MTVPIVAEHSGGYERNLGRSYNVHSINDTWTEVNMLVVVHIPDVIAVEDEERNGCP